MVPSNFSYLAEEFPILFNIGQSAEFNLHQDPATLPKVLPVEHHHYFEDKSLGFLFGGIILLLISALTVGLTFGLYRENTRMKENDIKFRMIRQSIPEAATWADTTYYRDPEETEKILKKLEAEKLLYANRKEGNEAIFIKG